MGSKSALILGVGGQDGGLLSKLLINKGYKVHGTSRNAENNTFPILSDLGIKSSVELHSVGTNDYNSLIKLIEKVNPEEIYNLSAQSSVALSFQKPQETIDSILDYTLMALEVIRILQIDTRFYQASSSEMFGNTSAPADEKTPFSPRSPYSVAKTAAHYLVNNYRQAYNIFACCGILFNHESQYRSSKYVTQRVAESAVKIALGQQDYLYLGNLDIKRDWGWAEEYVEAMWLMLQQDIADDYVIATGVSHSLLEYVKYCFSLVGLEAGRFIRYDSSQIRPSDVLISMADPRKAAIKLKWQAKFKMEDVARKLVDAALVRYHNGQKIK